MEIDLHGKNLYQARVLLMSTLKKATPADYRLRVIHVYHGGDTLRAMVQETASSHPKVLRIEKAPNEGETVLVLREYL